MSNEAAGELAAGQLAARKAAASQRSEATGGLRIAISGKSGCGNTTVSRLVAAQLGLRVVNYTFKDLAREKGVTFEDICVLAETDPQYDLTIDRMQVKLAEEGPCVLGSRLGSGSFCHVT